MLLEFNVGNFRSFGEDVSFSMVSTDLSARDEQLNVNNRTRINDKLTVLNSALIYGANASGKTNLALALRFMSQFALNSSREGQAGDPIPAEPFRLHTGLVDEPSLFEVVFRIGEIQYRYGFEINHEQVISEWLYYVRKREALLFHRTADDFKIMPAMQAEAQLIGLTRDNALFLSVAAQFNNTRATEVLDWFRSLRFLGSFLYGSMAVTAQAIASNPKLARRVERLISRLDTGIDSISTTVRTVERRDLPEDMSTAFTDLLMGREQIDVATSHSIFDEDNTIMGQAQFDLETHESGGTQKLFALAGPLLSTLDQGGVLIIDELDAQLHTLLSKAIIQLFHGLSTNPKGAQLIAMTHDTNLLDRRMLRRDQIWFVEKNARSQSELYSLASIKIRNDASYERDYLNGRLGAIPYPRRLAEAIRVDNQ